MPLRSKARVRVCDLAERFRLHEYMIIRRCFSAGLFQLLQICSSSRIIQAFLSRLASSEDTKVSNPLFAQHSIRIREVRSGLPQPPPAEMALWNYLAMLKLLLSPDCQILSQHHYHLGNINSRRCKRRERRTSCLGSACDPT